MILNGVSVKLIKQIYPNYYSKEKTMIGITHLFHFAHTGNDRPFFADIVHRKAVEVQNYESLTEKDLIDKIVKIYSPVTNL
jgi:hypothetical protein